LTPDRVGGTCLRWHNMNWTACPVAFTDEFGDWWDDLTAQEQASVRAIRKIARRIRRRTAVLGKI
jgi:hypothetical protein